MNKYEVCKEKLIKKERKIMEEKKILEIKRFKFILEENEDNFCVFHIDPVMLHPDINNEKLKEREVYDIKVNSHDGSHKGHIKLGLCFNSMTELHKFYIELRRLKYKPKIIEDEDLTINERRYKIKELEEKNHFNPFGTRNYLSIWIVEKDLDKFKQDLKKIGKILNYKCLWGDCDVITSRFPHYIVD